MIEFIYLFVYSFLLVEASLFLTSFSSKYRVSENMPLYDILNEFQKGHSHIAVVYKLINEKAETPMCKEGETLKFKDSCKKQRGQSEALEKGIDIQSMRKEISEIF